MGIRTKSAPSAGLALCLALALAGPAGIAQDKLSWGGFASVGYLKSSSYNYLANTEEGTFDYVEAGLNASWTPAKRTTVNGQVFLFELGPYGNYEPLVDYLFLDYSSEQNWGLRLGRIKRELGLYNHIQDIDMARTQILLPLGVYDHRYRGFSASVDGLSLYGSFELAQNQRLSYNLYSGYIDVPLDGGLAGYTLTTVSRLTVDNELLALETDIVYGAQLWYQTAIEGLTIGIGSSYMPNVSTTTRGVFPETLPNPFLAGQELVGCADNIRYWITQASFEYSLDDWTFTGEITDSEARFNLIQTLGGFPLFSDDVNSNTLAWYLSTARRLGAFEAALTYAHTPPDTGSLDSSNTDFQTDRQVSLRYDVNDHWTLKLEFHSMSGTRRLFNQYGQNPLLDERDWNLWATKSTFSF